MAKPKDPAKAPKVKKPYHIKKADLHLDEYIEDQNSKNPSLLAQRVVAHLKASFQFKLYLALQFVAVVAGYGQAMLIVGLLWAMIANTGKRKDGELSAYSLFNEDVQAIQGSTDMEALERELRTRAL
ncbi:Aminotransferase class IV [Botryosphaeria dothidea]|uniref:Aminotransferase class IV n=1 Tax=Botryosphaeria dothidea TaxID=55169 RepID=A0A8H4NFJ1_9PEZI|nr:Aminotransferase class IV [Botryosphaeria dothidea]